MLKAITESVRQ